MKTWFAELLDARPWYFYAAGFLFLCGLPWFFSPGPDALAWIALYLLAKKLPSWGLVNRPWLYAHTLLLLPLAWFVCVQVNAYIPVLYTFQKPEEYFRATSTMLYCINACALALMCVTLPLLRLTVGAGTRLVHLLAASFLLNVLLSKFVLACIIFFVIVPSTI